MAKLTPEEKAWLNDLFVLGGITPKNKSGELYNNEQTTNQDVAAAKLICKFIVERTFNFAEIADAIKVISKLKFKVDGNIISFDEKECSTAIAKFCHAIGAYWDDHFMTHAEMDNMFKKYPIAQAFEDNLCFTSQPEQTENSAVAPIQQDTPTAAPVAADAASQAPKAVAKQTQPATGGYKQSGAHSGDIPNLLGNPGNKIMLNGDVFTIIADATGKNTPSVFITPLKVTANGIKTVSKAEAEKVKFASGNGWSDCQLFFDNNIDADKALQNCVNSFSLNNMRVVKTKADKNGYFKVSTEFGVAYIKAGKLNEEYINEGIAARKAKCYAVKPSGQPLDLDIWDDVHNKD